MKPCGYNGATLIGTDTTAPYAVTWNNVPVGNYSLTAKATDNLGAVTTSTAVNVTVNANQAPSVSLTNPASGASYTAPASINLTATAADSDGSIATVEFYNGATLIGTATTTPYAIAWTNIPIGNYSLTAKATDNLGLAATSAAVGVTVEVGDASTLYFIHPDHLNSPRLITDAAGTTVWRWDNAEPFGANAPIDDPDGDGKHLTFNLRYPGQYHDAESGLSYNYHRDYDPATGRYVESDPIGLAGGINTYAYVENDPLNKIDPYGLMGGGAGPNRKPNLGPFGPYCGPEGSILATWIPDLNVEACKKHDKCYDDCARRCEGKWCKYRCDVVLDQSIPFYGFATYFGGDEIYENLKKKYGCDKCDKKMMDD